MGIIKAAMSAVGTSLADQWLEVIEAENMGDQTVFTKGMKTRTGQNKKGLDDVISNGSVIHVYPNQFMLLLDGGKVVTIRRRRAITRWTVPPCLLFSTEASAMR